MPNEQFTLLEATPQTIANLNRLKSISPHLNLGATEMSKGNNSGIVATPPSAGNAVITGPFDVKLTYLDEDGEMVPYIQVFDSSLQNATYAGTVYYQNTIRNILAGRVVPSAGWLYLEVDLLKNIATYNIASIVPTYPLSWKKWAYALAVVNVSDNSYIIRQLHVPGNIIMPSLDDTQGPFDIQLTYSEEEDGQGGTEMVPYLHILDSSRPNDYYAGKIYYQNQRIGIPQRVLAPSDGWLYLEVDLLNNTSSFYIGLDVPSYPISLQKWVYVLADIIDNDNTYIINKVHKPGDIVMPTFDDGYQGYFKLSFAYENTTDQQTGEVTQTQRIYCSGGLYCIGGQVGAMPAGYVTGNLSTTMKAIILHYHIDLQSDTDSLELVLGTFNARNFNSTATDAYWLVGHASTTQIIQQSHGVPQLFLIGDCES